MTRPWHEKVLIELVPAPGAGLPRPPGAAAGGAPRLPVDGWDAVCGEPVPVAVSRAANGPSPAPLVPWQDSFALGIPAVDAQHRGFIGMLNDLHDALGAPGSAEAARAVQEHLRRYAARHFADEEEFLGAVEYPGLEAQRADHARFLRCLDAFDVERPHAHAVLSFMTAWVLQHVLGADRGYLDWLSAERPGVGPAA